MMRKMMTFTLMLFLGINLTAQEIVIPKNLQLETDEDYQSNEKLVLESIQWLQETPLSKNPDKRKEINVFLIQWMSGSPTVTIELVSGLVPLDCPDCLVAFMSGWTKYSIENNYSKDKLKCALAGVERTISFYEKNKSEIGKNSDIEKLIKMKNKGKLEKHIESKY